ncbi:MAG: lytic transglycosylase domain-containing protein [Thermodesulfobacteriota bacterium]
MEPPPVEVSEAPEVPEPEESLTEQLSPKRLEELYAKSGIRGTDPALEEELKNWDQRLKFDVPIAMNKQVRAYLVYFTTERKQTIRRYLSRSTAYLPMIREIFAEHGLPEDFAYLAMIESGFNPNAYSHAHACGMWQFIRGTGARYGLAIDSYIDERRDPEKSTHAAAKYLLDLYKQFGSWYLAAASYNCGEGRVQKEINQSSHRNFWELSANQCLPTETKNYVPQMIAATIIAKNPEKFGFKNIPYLPPLKFDKVKVNEPTSLAAASFACNVPLDDIQALNPELRRGVTPPDLPGYTLKLPVGAKNLFEKNIMVARVEHPAVAARAVRVAKSSYRRSSPDKESSHQAVVASGKSERPAKKTVAKRSKKSRTQLASVRKSKSSPKVAGHGGSGPQMASILGASSDLGKRKPKALKSRGNKTGSTQLAKKSGNGEKSSYKGKKSSKSKPSKEKKKVSKKKSRRQIMVSKVH